jgi:hypothetical protein
LISADCTRVALAGDAALRDIVQIIAQPIADQVDAEHGQHDPQTLALVDHGCLVGGHVHGHVCLVILKRE